MSVAVEPITFEQRPPPPGPVSFEQFLDWMDEDTHAEWVAGTIIMTSPASAVHQDIRDFLVSLIRLYVEMRQLGRVLGAPFMMYTPTRPSGREPDLLFVRSEHLDRMRATFLDGPADLVVEITSPESDARDRGDKFVEYEAAGIPEYWLIDPMRRTVAFYRLDQDGRYRAALLDAEDAYHSTMVEGFWIEPAWLWRDPLPDLAWAVAQVGGATHARAALAALQSSIGRDEIRKLLDEKSGTA